MLLVWVQPVPALQPSSVQTLPSSQLGGGPPTQLPPLQWSLVVQASLSLHGAVLLMWVQPVLAVQLSVVHGLPSSQLGGEPPVQMPAWQVSLVVQALPSSQSVPFGLIRSEHAPVAGLQVPAMWH